MDFVVLTDHLPAPGETVLGREFRMIPGGKGANQACAAGRLARVAIVRMVGRVGCDVFGDQLKANLAAANVDVSAVTGTRVRSTGVALIEVDSTGQNSIVVASGANFAFEPADIESSRAAYRNAKCALFQLETPLETVGAALKIARAEGALTILDPAPAQALSADLLGAVDILTPNESEACILLGRTAARVGIEEVPECARAILGLGVRSVLLKLGEAGCFYADAERQLHSPGFRVQPVDTTAAGDTFNAGLAVALSEDRDLPSALRFANAAAAVSVTRMGAQASVPSREEVDALMNRQ
jgi:ribokinase